MKVNVRVTADRLRERLEVQRIAARLRADVERELQVTIVTEQPLDFGTRRDALERAVRRIWGATL